MNRGVCKLCLEDKELQRKSHIIPEFMYRELFDEKGRVVGYKGQNTRKKYDIAQSGIYEADILCKKCDNEIIGKNETYAKKILYDNDKIKEKETEKGTKFIEITDVNYNKLKLFFLSLIWRSSISSKKFFVEVDLGPYEEKIRKKIISEDPGTTEEYPCVLFSYREHKKKISVGLNFKPVKGRFKNVFTYSFLINGIDYIFRVTEREEEGLFKQGSVNERGVLKIFCLPEEKAKRMINNALGLELYS